MAAQVRPLESLQKKEQQTRDLPDMTEVEVGGHNSLDVIPTASSSDLSIEPTTTAFVETLDDDMADENFDLHMSEDEIEQSYEADEVPPAKPTNHQQQQQQQQKLQQSIKQEVEEEEEQQQQQQATETSEVECVVKKEEQSRTEEILCTIKSEIPDTPSSPSECDKASMEVDGEKTNEVNSADSPKKQDTAKQPTPMETEETEEDILNKFDSPERSDNGVDDNMEDELLSDDILASDKNDEKSDGNKSPKTAAKKTKESPSKENDEKSSPSSPDNVAGCETKQKANAEILRNQIMDTEDLLQIVENDTEENNSDKDHKDGENNEDGEEGGEDEEEEDEHEDGSEKDADDSDKTLDIEEMTRIKQETDAEIEREYRSIVEDAEKEEKEKEEQRKREQEAAAAKVTEDQADSKGRDGETETIENKRSEESSLPKGVSEKKDQSEEASEDSKMQTSSELDKTKETKTLKRSIEAVEESDKGETKTESDTIPPCKKLKKDDDSGGGEDETTKEKVKMPSNDEPAKLVETPPLTPSESPQPANPDVTVVNSIVDEKKKAKEDLLAKFLKKRDLTTLTKEDLEDVIIQCICEAICFRSEIGQLRHQLSEQEQMAEMWRKEVAQLSKQARDLEIVNKRLLHEVRLKNERDKPLMPVKITRSVGLQVRSDVKPVEAPPQNATPPPATANQTKQKNSTGHQIRSSHANATTKTTVPPSQPTRTATPLHHTNNKTTIITSRNANTPSPHNRASFQRQNSSPASTGMSSKQQQHQQQQQQYNSAGTQIKPNPVNKNSLLSQALQSTSTQIVTSTVLVPPVTTSVPSSVLNSAPALYPLTTTYISSTSSSSTVSASGSTLSSGTILSKSNVTVPAGSKSGGASQQAMMKNGGTSLMSSSLASSKKIVAADTSKNCESVIDLTEEDTPPPLSVVASLTAKSGGTVSAGTGTTGIRLLSGVTPNKTTVTQQQQQQQQQVGSTVAAPQRIMYLYNQPTTLNSKVMFKLGTGNGMISVANGSTLMQTAAAISQNQQKSLLKPMTVTSSLAMKSKHPAPLPAPPVSQLSVAARKPIPPKPHLSIRRSTSGIVLSWKMPYHLDNYETIVSYQLYAYQETTAPPNSDMWRKVGDVKALALPMACTLTQFADGNKYHFAVRAVDTHKRMGPFSDPENILL